MQIALTKKLAEAMEIKPSPVRKVINPLFTWTANWTKVWDNRRTEDMLVLVNNAGTECAYHAGNNYNGVAKMFSDTVGASVNYRLVGYTNNQDADLFRIKRCSMHSPNLPGNLSTNIGLLSCLLRLIWRFIRRHDG